MRRGKYYCRLAEDRLAGSDGVLTLMVSVKPKEVSVFEYLTKKCDTVPVMMCRGSVGASAGSHR